MAQELIDLLASRAARGFFPPEAVKNIGDFLISYTKLLGEDQKKEGVTRLTEWLMFVIEQLQSPFAFEVYHRAIRTPFDYYRFGLDFIRPLIDFHHSKLHGELALDEIQKQLRSKDNVIFLANHQTEPDPQIISLMLEKRYPDFAENMIFVAGHRVISDPLAVPFSLGRNLLCIYSKKHIDHPPEEKAGKILHNKRTLSKMVELLCEGGKCIYVAPSGGRDRPDAQGRVEPAPFDPDSLELFWLMAKQAAASGKQTHFYPLALNTYAIMPPPDNLRKELGETRVVNFAPVFLSCGAEVRMDHFPGSDASDKLARREARARYIGGLVGADYQKYCRKGP